MDISTIMAKQVSELQHTLNLNLLKSQMATQAAQVTNMMKAMNTNHHEAPHPYKGQSIDVQA
ncbi:hypothetical protein J2S13_003017 [Oikeobacillus pervagus]|uniref:Uncharacterized protein n=1 Tax=Oikeobacillus pervagus TaxID=1325931 RepID=A0AAJ1WKA8_9BACI|nr:polyribonucleotide nucleotidyltransferase [Oikeobacillus pervagus]MDQ0216555.1 hypothetical protein [Oikeobacillus pervagus]